MLPNGMEELILQLPLKHVMRIGFRVQYWDLPCTPCSSVTRGVNRADIWFRLGVLNERYIAQFLTSSQRDIMVLLLGVLFPTQGSASFPGRRYLRSSTPRAKGYTVCCSLCYHTREGPKMWKDGLQCTLAGFTIVETEHIVDIFCVVKSSFSLANCIFIFYLPHSAQHRQLGHAPTILL